MREDHRETIEAHVAGICFHETAEGILVLVAKRQPTRALYPGLWECGGGQVRSGENFEEAVARQMREEFGVIVERALPFGTYEIGTPDLPQGKIPGIKFVCFWKGYAMDADSPVCDGREHSECRWQPIDDLSGFDFIPGIRDDIRRGWEVFSRNRDLVRTQ
jgi:8-oxo-dGTP pyrophosphatase MutT (NUDIX family)